MKRFLALVLVLALVLAPAAVFAEDPAPPQVPTAVVVKNLALDEGRVNPAEDFVFEFTKLSPANAPDIPDVTISYGTGDNGLKTGALNLDGFADEAVAVGRYQYEVTEVGGSTAGMVYSDRTGTLVVTKNDGK